MEFAELDDSRWLEAATEGDDTEITRLLFENDALINTTDICGWSALHFATSKGHEKVG